MALSALPKSDPPTAAGYRPSGARLLARNPDAERRASHSGGAARFEPSGLGPTLFGGFRRKLLLPVEALRPLPDRELGLLLEHEYHHSRAGDPLLNLGALFLWALVWYNPFMLIARRRLRSCCELECDRKVLERHPQAVCEYGNLLLRFASAGTQVPAVTLGLAESPRELSRRIRSMTAAVRPRSGERRFGTVAALLIAALLAAPVCLVAVNAKPAARPRPASTATARPMRRT